MNKNMMIEYQLIFDMNYKDQYMSACQFGNAASVFFGIRSMSNTGNWDKIYMYNYLFATAKYQYGAMLSVASTVNGFLDLRSMIVDTYNGHVWYAG